MGLEGRLRIGSIQGQALPGKTVALTGTALIYIYGTIFGIGQTRTEFIPSVKLQQEIRTVPKSELVAHETLTKRIAGEVELRP